MALCEYCRNDSVSNSGCSYCGRYLTRFDECQIVCGTDSKTEIVRLSVTDKYMMIHRTSGGEKGIAASFGLIGTITAAALSKGTLYGYYDMKEIAKVIYPYHNKKYKKDNALKIVNKDGSDLIIKSVVGGISMEKVAKCFSIAGVAVDSSGSDFGNVFCAKPFVDKKTMGSRICPSAVSFVKPVKGNFYAESVSGQPAAPASAPTTPPAPTPAPTPVKEEPVTPPPPPVRTEPPKKEEPPKVIYVQPVTQQPEEKPAAVPVYTPPVQTTPEPPKTSEFKFCYNCGQKIGAEYKFCFNCGKEQ